MKNFAFKLFNSTKTVDTVFETQRESWRSLIDEVKGLILSITQQYEGIKSLFVSLSASFAPLQSAASFEKESSETSSINENQVKTFKIALDKFETAFNKYSSEYLQAHGKLKQYVVFLLGFKERVSQRDNHLIDFEIAQDEFISSEKTKDKDPAKFQRAETRFHFCKQAYEEYNDELKLKLEEIISMRKTNVDDVVNLLFVCASELFKIAATAFHGIYLQ